MGEKAKNWGKKMEKKFKKNFGGSGNKKNGKKSKSFVKKGDGEKEGKGMKPEGEGKKLTGMGLPEDFLDKKHDDKCKFMGNKAKESKGKDMKANFGVCGFCMDKWSQWENEVDELETGDIKKHCKEFKAKFSNELKEFTGKIMDMEKDRDAMKKGGKGEGKGDGQKGDGEGKGQKGGEGEGKG